MLARPPHLSSCSMIDLKTCGNMEVPRSRWYRITS